MLVLTLMAVLSVAQPTSTTQMSPPGAAATPLQPRPLRVILDGRVWSCGASGPCSGRGAGASQPILRECRRLVARVGAVAAFSRGDVALDAAQLAQCNAAARPASED